MGVMEEMFGEQESTLLILTNVRLHCTLVLLVDMVDILN